MVYTTPLPTDILNLVFQFADVNKEYKYYKQKKKSQTGFKQIKLHYNCQSCNKKIRRNKDAVYGFMIDYYDYYKVKMPDVLVGKKTLSRFYHFKKNNQELDFYDKLRNVEGHVTESPFAISITMLNRNQGKVLGKIIIKTFNYINKSYVKLDKCKKMFNNIEVAFKSELVPQEEVNNDIISFILDNNDNLKIGHHCKNCINNNKIAHFVKL